MNSKPGAMQSQDRPPTIVIPRDFLDGSGDQALLFTLAGERVKGTLEVSEAFGRLCDLARAEDGSITYDFVEGNEIVEGGDFFTEQDEHGRTMYVSDSGKHVPESEIVLVSPSRESEFLKQFAV